MDILLFSSLAVRFRSASRPVLALPPLRRPADRGARHYGGCSPGMRKRRHVLLAGLILLLGQDDAVAWQPEEAAGFSGIGK